MAQESQTGDVGRGSGESGIRGPGGGTRSRRRLSSGDTAEQVRAVKAALIDILGPHERLVTYLQAVVLWEKPVHSVLLYTLTNCGFW
ncbi:Reticulophagy regulator 3 [Bagarius yarrelli]|uniref:Reticulophagy regulator 3 n=1 Tax=Bagarius yarrelli TaxID=175774 RepID=A0A556TND3_BAGYA|nr:Reticulophagy regulator 3 [Bagarius yarrelli]